MTAVASSRPRSPRLPSRLPSPIFRLEGRCNLRPRRAMPATSWSMAKALNGPRRTMPWPRYLPVAWSPVSPKARPRSPPPPRGFRGASPSLSQPSPLLLPSPVNLGLETVASGLDFPTYLTSPPNDTRLFVTEKAGAIRIIKDGTVLPTPFLDLTPQVASQAGEQGLLGLVFASDYATSGRFFVHYTDDSGASQISSFRVSADPDRADPASESVVLTASRPGTAHNGGQLLFGPDGYLYIGLGDGEDSDGGRGQSLSDQLAAGLRIDVSGATRYAVPPDNPFLTTPRARPEVWSYGLRNPWRFSFDRATGDLYIGEVGESRYEEVNYSSAAEGAGRGLNYGWAVMEGPDCVRGGTGCDQTGLTPPTVSYEHPDGCSVTGGYVYRGIAIPGLHGTYFYSDFCGGWVRSFRMEGGIRVGDTEWSSLDTGEFVTSFGEDA